LEEIFLYHVDLFICRTSGDVMCLFKIPRNATRQHDEGRMTGNFCSTIRQSVHPCWSCYGTSSMLPCLEQIWTKIIRSVWFTSCSAVCFPNLTASIERLMIITKLLHYIHSIHKGHYIVVVLVST